MASTEGKAEEKIASEARGLGRPSVFLVVALRAVPPVINWPQLESSNSLAVRLKALIFSNRHR